MTQRVRTIAQVRLRHACRAIAIAHYGESAGWSDYEGSLLEGRFWCTSGSGDHHLIVWSARGIVALAFDHDSPFSEASIPVEQRRPEQIFARAPVELSAEVAVACAWGERLATAGWWIVCAPGGDQISEHGETSQLRGYHLGAEDALGAGRGGSAWRASESISAAHARLAEKLARQGGAPSRNITEDEARVILARPPRLGGVPKQRNLEFAAMLLGQLGLPWPDVAEHARRVEQENAEREGTPEPNVALLRAAFRGDVAEVARLLDAGADIEVKSRKRDLPDAIDARQTPLLAAISQRQWEVALLLIARGANPNARVVYATALVQAATYGGLEACRALLAAGADLEPPGGVNLLRAASYSRDVAIVRLLLDAGAPLPRRGECEGIARLAERSGDHDLARRVLAPWAGSAADAGATDQGDPS